MIEDPDELVAGERYTTSGPSVLIADDDPAIRPLIAAICRRAGFRCDTASDGAEALAKLRSGIVYDVLVLDLMMPKVSGYEVIATLRELAVRPAVIVLTAQGPRQTEGIADGNIVHALLTKPFDIHELESLISDTAESKYVLRASESGGS
ncbi:MAG TPA: response regulator [Thermoanaerobaculia bacterium]